MKKNANYLWSKKWVRVISWGVVWIASLLVLFVQGTNWYGNREWQKISVLLQQRGETLDLRAITLPPLSPEDNFGALPALYNIAMPNGTSAEAQLAEKNRERLSNVKLPEKNESNQPPSLATGYNLGIELDVMSWREFFVKEGSRSSVLTTGDQALDVMNASFTDDSLLEELTQGLDREYSQITPEWKTRDLPGELHSLEVPHYATLQQLTQSLALRASAAVHAGKTSEALNCIRISLRLNYACLNEPLLIGTLVGAAGTATTGTAVWEYCHKKTGDESSYITLEKELLKIDFEEAYLRAIRGEACASAVWINWWNKTRDPHFLAMMRGAGDEAPFLLNSSMLHVTPQGWFTLNQANVIKAYYKYLITPLKEKGLAELVRKSRHFDEEIKQTFNKPGHFMVKITLPIFNGVGIRMARAQSMIDQAIIACALERYFIKHGFYPPSLVGLTLHNGDELPNDASCGRPMGYKPTADGRYKLWAQGVDGVDDGGSRGLNPEDPEKTKFMSMGFKGDWVWSYSPE